jgi:hypothetical protein
MSCDRSRAHSHSKPGNFVEFSKWETKPDAKLDKCKGPGVCALGGTHKPNGVESACVDVRASCGVRVCC